MSSIYPDSMLALKSELELYGVPKTQIAFEDSRYEEVYPITSLDRGTPLEFRVTSDTNEYIDLSQCFLYTKCKIVKRAGSAALVEPNAPDAAVPDPSVVYPINYFHATQFKNVEVYLNGTPVSSDDNMYAYRAIIELLSSYSKNTLERQFACGMYHSDNNDLNEHGNEVTNPNDRDVNKGARKRFSKTKYSKSFEMFGRIHADIFSQNKHLMNGVELRIRLNRQDPKFCLMSKVAAENYAVVIEKAILYVKQDKVLPSIREAHVKELEKRHAKYYIRKVQMKYFTRSPNINDLSETELCKGTLPRRIILGLVDSEGFNGHQHRNPLNFEDFNIRSLQLKINGQAKPMEKLEFDFRGDNYLMGYLSMHQANGMLFQNEGLSVSPEEYKNGHTLFGFDLNPNSGDDMSLVTDGKIGVEIKLAENHSRSITIVVYLEYDDVIEIDNFKNVVK